MILLLTDGDKAIIDDDDYDRVIAINKNWYLNGHGYVHTRTNNVLVDLHRVILKSTDTNLVVDHINRIKLDNRKVNLRLVTRSCNGINATNLNPDRGTYYLKRNKKWIAQLAVNKKQHYLGGYLTRDLAIKAVMEFEKTMQDEFYVKRLPHQLPTDHPEYKAWK